MGDTMNSITYAFLVSGLAGLSTMLGTILIFFKKRGNNILIASLAFAAGVMICVSFTDLLPSSLDLLQKTFRGLPAFLFMGIAFVVGMIFSMLIDRYLPEEKSHGSRLYQVGLISMLAIILHNIPEGIATFMATTSDAKLGLTLAIAIALHNIPEGIGISVPIYYATGSKGKSLLYTFISGISEPFGALLAYWFLSPFITDTLMGLLFAFIAGIMLHISSYELLPTSLQYKEKKKTWIFFLIGFSFMLLNHFLFL